MSEMGIRMQKQQRSNSKNHTAYQNRVQNLFARVNKIQNLNQDGRKEKARELEDLLNNLEGKLEKEKQDKNQKIEQMEEVIQELRKSLREDAKARENMEGVVEDSLIQLENDFSLVLDKSMGNIFYCFFSTIKRLNILKDIYTFQSKFFPK